MKKTLYLFLALFIILPITAGAATFDFSPNTGSFEQGEIFNVIVSVKPILGQQITTAKLSITFPADKLEVISFNQSTGWMFFPTPDSDLIDNLSGQLIKMGGFPAIVTESKEFGTLVLKAKGAGSAGLTIEDASLMLDITSTDKLTDSGSITFTITAPQVVAVVPDVAVEEVAVSTTDQTAQDLVQDGSDDSSDTTLSSEDLDLDLDVEGVTNTATQQDQIAAVAGSGENNIWYYLVVLALLFFGFYGYKRMKPKKND